MYFLLSFQAHLEDLAEKDATEKSDAAREAFLAELELDSIKGISGGSEHSRHIQEKAKDKKKNKDHRRTKDSKVYPCSLVSSFSWGCCKFMFKILELGLIISKLCRLLLVMSNICFIMRLLN